MQKYLLLILFFLLISCNNSQENKHIDIKPNYDVDATVDYGLLRNSVGSLRFLSNSNDGVFFYDLLKQYNEENTNKDSKILIKYYSFKDNESYIIHNNPSVRCSRAEPEKCSGLTDINNGGSSVLFYNGKLFDYNVITTLSDNKSKFNLYVMDLDGTNRSLHHSIDLSSSDDGIAIFPTFHKGYMHIIDANKIHRIKLETLDETENFAEFLYKGNALNVDQYFLYDDYMYVAVDAIKYAGEYIKNALFKIDLNTNSEELLYTYNTHSIIFYDNNFDKTFLYDKDLNIKLMDNKSKELIDVLDHPAVIYTYKDNYALFYDDTWSGNVDDKPTIMIVDNGGKKLDEITLDGTPWILQGIIGDNAYYYADDKLMSFNLVTKDYIVVDNFE